MSRTESNLAESFYYFINEVPMKKWWEFIRILGLPESDIDEIFYDDDDPSEQKYQMLSRWKSYYGYKKADQEIVDVLKLAYNEIQGNVLPEELNRKLRGHLLENRFIAIKFYEIMRKLDGRNRKKFSMVKLRLSDSETNSIMADYSKDVDEQCYQMFLAWRRRNQLHRYQDIQSELEKFLEDFLQQNAPGCGSAPRPPPENRVQQASWDTGMVGRAPPYPLGHGAPSGDITDSSANR